MKAYAPTARSKVKRLHERGHYDQDTLYATRMLRHLGKGVDCCLAVTHVDGLVPVSMHAGIAKDDGRLAARTRRPANVEGFAHLGLAPKGK